MTQELHLQFQRVHNIGHIIVFTLIQLEHFRCTNRIERSNYKTEKETGVRSNLSFCTTVTRFGEIPPLWPSLKLVFGNFRV